MMRYVVYIVVMVMVFLMVWDVCFLSEWNEVCVMFYGGSDVGGMIGIWKG